MRMQVSIRVAGETKGSPTYARLIEDLIEVGLGRGTIVQAGFADYKMVPVSVQLHGQPLAELDEQLGSDLLVQLKQGMGVDPRMLSGRLTVILELAVDEGRAQAAITSLRARGYAAEPSTS